MNKKILIGVSAIFVAAGFWACGSGDIIAKGEDEKTAEIVDEEMINQLKDKAIKECQESPECAEKMTEADQLPEPESSADGGDTPNPGGDDDDGDGGKGGPIEKSSTSRVVPPDGSSDSGSNNPGPTTTSSTSATTTDANVPDGNCNASPSEIVKGKQVTWTFTAADLAESALSGSIMDKINQQNKYKEMVNASTCTWTIKGAGEGGKDLTTSGTCGGDAKTVTATYAGIGNFTASVKLGEKTIPCGTTVAVTGAPVTGCKCTVDETNPDVKDGDVTVTWTVSGCMAGSAAADIGTYAWTGATGTTATATATVSKKGDTKSASVKVTSTENASMNVTSCPSVKAVNSDIPDFELVKGETLEVPVGQCGVASVAGVVRFEHPYEASDCDIALTIDGTEYTKTVSYCNVYYGVLPCDGVNVSAGTQICVNEVTSSYGKLKMKYN